MKKAKPPVVAPQDGAITWACPTCGAEAHKHGRGGSDACVAREGRCDGFVCECDDFEGGDHGVCFANPCTNAVCCHCGWQGQFPPKPKGLQAWEKKALDAGWTPPHSRFPTIQTGK